MRRPSSDGNPTIRSSGGDYAALPGDDFDREGEEERSRAFAAGDRGDSGAALQQELRLNVFREVLFSARPPRAPHCGGPRPKHFPQQVGIFHTGALYASVHRAFGGLFPFYNGVYILSFAALLLVFTVGCWGTPVMFLPTEDGGRKFNYAGYALCAMGVYQVSAAAAFLVTRPAVERFHGRMDAVVLELAPIFRRVGYDLEYRRGEAAALASRPTLWSRLARVCERQAFVRIVPFRGDMQADEAARASALWDPRRRSEARTAPAAGRGGGGASVEEGTTPRDANAGEYRVAVYGAQAYPGHMGFGREPNFLYTRSLLECGERMDEYTWGAVASEMRAYVDMYHHARSWTCVGVLVLFQAPVWMTDWLASWYTATPYIVLIVCLYVFLFYPTAMEAWWLTNVWGLPGLDEVQAAIQRLSPLVEERSGYALRFHLEPDGCLGGTGAYVCFVPPESPEIPASSTV